eukprot:gene20274-biopygen20562
MRASTSLKNATFTTAFAKSPPYTNHVRIPPSNGSQRKSSMPRILSTAAAEQRGEPLGDPAAPPSAVAIAHRPMCAWPVPSDRRNRSSVLFFRV